MSLWLLLSAALAAPEHCPAPVDGANLVSVAEAAWSAGPGADDGALEDAHRRARLQALGAGTGLSVSASSEVLPDQPDQLEDTLTAAVSVSLGRFGAAQRRAVDARAESSRQSRDASRWGYTEEAIEAWLSWRTAALEAEHLTEYLQESAEALEPLRQGQQRGLVTRLALADMETELSRIQTELRAAEAAAAIAQASLSGLLEGCAVAAGAPPVAPDWDALVARAGSHPSVTQLQAAAASADASRLQARTATPPTLQAGVSARRVGGAEVYRGPMVSLSVPLRSSGRSAATQYAAQSDALERQADWQAERIAAQLASLRAAHQALQAQRDALALHDLSPMTERVQLATEALAASQLDVATLIRARRDLHEAEHRLLVLDLALEASALRADLLLALLEEAPDARP